MKHLVDLATDDLTATPVWSYEGGTGADALVAPAARGSLSRTDDEVFLAATEFVLPDSSHHLGFCFPADDSGIDYLQPVIVAPGGHVRFWFEQAPATDALSRQWGVLGKRAEEIFPVRFRCLVPVDGRTITGAIAQVEVSPDSPQAVAAPKTPDATEPSRPVARRLLRADGALYPTARTGKARPFSGSGFRSGEKRTAPRRNVEMMVEFVQGASYGTGVTGDISRAGMFVRTTRVPSTGPLLRLTVHLPEGRKLFLTGRVVRSAAAPGSLGFVTPSGFGFRLAGESPEYEKFLSQLPEKPK